MLHVGFVMVLAGGLVLTSSGCFDESGRGASPGGAGGTGATETGGAAGESCVNGVDDDADLLVDCADADCAGQGYTCKPAPAEWAGPVLLLGAASESDCPIGWSLDDWQGGEGDVAETPCGACSTCDPPTASGPEPPSANCGDDFGFYGYADASCGGSGSHHGILFSTCFTMTAGSYRVSPLVLSGHCGTSSASGGGCELLATHARCLPASLPAGGCGPDEVCAPPEQDGMALCWYSPGVQTSCLGSLSDRTPIVLFQGVDNQRACGCECQGACDAFVDVWYGVAECAGPPSERVAADGECHTNAGEQVMSLDFFTETPACHTISAVDGECSPSEPVTFCCSS